MVSSGQVLISGGGPVGLALGCALSGEVRLVDPRPDSSAAVDAGPFEQRILALSPGSKALLQRLGAWARMPAHRIAAVHRMEVFGDRRGRIAFDGAAGRPLALIAEASNLTHALREEFLARHPGSLIVANVESVAADASGAAVRLSTGQELRGDLVAGADGSDSPLRALLRIDSIPHAYGETALVANFDTELHPQGVARQWFTAEGVLAWLPLPGNRMSIVWSAPDGIAAELLSLDERAFERRVRDRGGAVLGDLRLASPLASFPLRALDVPQPVAAGAALLGDAAHGVHPLAGQGVNLGFRDADLLARVLAERSPLERPGDLAVLRRYARGRREDVLATQWLTRGLDRLFAHPAVPLARLRNAGLGFVHRQSWLKRRLAAHAVR